MIEFESIDAFVAYLEGLAAKVVDAAPHGLEGAAKFLEGEAKACLGHYQTGADGIPDWELLSTTTQILRAEWGYPDDEPLDVTGDLRSHIEHAVDAAKLEAAVGVPSVIVGDHDNPHGDPHTRYRDIGEVALDQEMGGRLPQRSFLALSAAKHHDEICRMLADPVRHAMAGEMPVSAHDDEPPF
jgi:hypothetical protein